MKTAERSAREVADELRAAVVAERRAEAAKLALVCELADAYRSVVPVLDMPGGPRTGVFEWTSPLGYRYRVDHRGTILLDPVG